MPAKSAPSLIRTPAPPPAVSRSSFPHHPARTHPSCTRTKSSVNALTPSLVHDTLAFSSGVNAPTSATIPEGCSRGCSIRSGPETVRQSPCMAPGSLFIWQHSRLVRHARTANGSFCAPSACQVLPIVRGSQVLQPVPDIRLPPFMDHHQAGAAQRTACRLPPLTCRKNPPATTPIAFQYFTLSFP